MPEALKSYIGPDKTIEFEGCTILHSCRHDSEYSGAALSINHQILFVKEGFLKVMSGHECISATAGQAVLMRKGSNYSFVKRAQEGGIYNSVLFFVDSAFVQKFLKQSLGPKPKQVAKVKPVQLLPSHDLVNAFAESLLPYFGSDLMQHPQLMEAKTFEFMVLMTNLYPEVNQLFEQTSQEGKLALEEVMEQYYAEHQLTMAQLAELSGRSLASFKRDFKATFNIPPAQWLQQRRLTAAHQLLASSSRSIADVAWECGFEDQSHFSRVFKQRYGYPPSAFRSSTATANTN